MTLEKLWQYLRKDGVTYYSYVNIDLNVLTHANEFKVASFGYPELTHWQLKDILDTFEKNYVTGVTSSLIQSGETAYAVIPTFGANFNQSYFILHEPGLSGRTFEEKMRSYESLTRKVHLNISSSRTSSPSTG